jgi:hypothetical protein
VECNPIERNTWPYHRTQTDLCDQLEIGNQGKSGNQDSMRYWKGSTTLLYTETCYYLCQDHAVAAIP